MLLSDCVDEPIGMSLPRSNHDATITLRQVDDREPGLPRAGQHQRRSGRGPCEAVERDVEVCARRR